MRLSAWIKSKWRTWVFTEGLSGYLAAMVCNNAHVPLPSSAFFSGLNLSIDLTRILAINGTLQVIGHHKMLFA